MERDHFLARSKLHRKKLRCFVNTYPIPGNGTPEVGCSVPLDQLILHSQVIGATFSATMETG